MILIADPRVLSIPLVELKNQNAIIFGPSPEIPNNTNYTKLRKNVYEKLLEAQKLLRAELKFCLYEGYRSLALQEKLFLDRYQAIKNIKPKWTHQEIFLETIKLVSPVINLDGSQNIPPHSTGGAVDLYLVDRQNNPVEMGIPVGDWMQDVDGSLSQTDSECISEAAKKNRDIMSSVLTELGFVNYPTEYWHWSYGDRYWAYHKKESYALYGSI
jgi:zinc D-Ala-D-Ala dipeptidase